MPRYHLSQITDAAVAKGYPVGTAAERGSRCASCNAAEDEQHDFPPSCPSCGDPESIHTSTLNATCTRPGCYCREVFGLEEQQ